MLGVDFGPIPKYKTSAILKIISIHLLQNDAFIYKIILNDKIIFSHLQKENQYNVFFGVRLTGQRDSNNLLKYMINLDVTLSDIGVTSINAQLARDRKKYTGVGVNQNKTTRF